MEIEQNQINKKQHEGFDEETKLKIQACLDEIDRKQQQQQKILYNKTKYIRFVFDRERKILYFTGKFDIFCLVVCYLLLLLLFSVNLI